MVDRDVVRTALVEAADLHRRVADERGDAVVLAADRLRAAIAAGRQVLVFGNGGSATDAQHFAAELVGRFMKERRPVPVLSLTTDTAVLTCLGNDYGYDRVFARQVEAFVKAGDVVMGITTSGASTNVNLALSCARARGAVTIGLTGRDGGETGRLVDVHLNVPHADTARIQEVQRTMLHVLCQLMEKDLT